MEKLHRKPHLAMVFVDLLVDPQQVLMVTVASTLREIGYEIEACLIATHPNAIKLGYGQFTRISEVDDDKDDHETPDLKITEAAEKNSVTGEHKCMLLKPLATDDIEVIERDQFHHHLMLEAERRDLRNICENKSCIILVHSTSGYEGIRRSLGNRIIHDLFLTDNIHGYVESLAVTDGSSG
ncbi:hypothetical protein Tco_0471017 [Tanacetum coccineum]